MAANDYPNPEHCLALLERFQMPEHIVRHSMAVCAVALYLSKRLSAAGVTLNLQLIQSAALLHDITKRYSFERPLDHALTGAKLLRKLGHHQIAFVVRQHVRLSGYRPNGGVSEAEIVNYSDKRVVHDRITTLDDRLNYIKEIYGRSGRALERIDFLAVNIYRLEEEIFTALSGGPEQVLHLDIEKESRL